MDPTQTLLPKPAGITTAGGALRCAASVQVNFSGVRSPRLERAVQRLEAGMRRMCATAGQSPAGDKATPAALRLQIACSALGSPHPALGEDEAYRLSVARGGVELRAECEWGVLHGLSTLLQLLDAPDASGCGVPWCEVDDAPRFPWRGVLIDVARHFISVPTLKRTLDGMALCKLNVLHLHLTDDQAFRFPSAAFPALPSDEYYSPAELEELVAYAADRGVRVVPEIDVPGHTNCWLVAYPEWGTQVARPTRRFGVHEACLDPSREPVYAALEVLLGEVATLFPDSYLHVGGDEVHPAWWTADPGVQRFMADQGLADVAALQAFFIRRVTQIAAGLDRMVVGWDEVLHADLPSHVLVQGWRGATVRDRILAQGNDCVVSSNYYLDLFYPAEYHYRFDPEADTASLIALEDELLDDARFAHVAEGIRWTHHWRGQPQGDAAGPGTVVGAEACLWGELVTDALLDVRLWSRLPVLAERFWSPAHVADVDNLYLRLPTCFQRLALFGGIDIAADSAALLAGAGVTDPWRPLTDLLEPVKWYGRLLGEAALSARLAGTEMPQARPYDADTPLNRPVDGLLPESFSARKVARLCTRHRSGDTGAGETLRQKAEAWQALAALTDCLPELAGSADKLARLGAMVLGVLDGEVDRQAALQTLESAAEPDGEYVIALVPALRTWVEAGTP